jgi:mRNA-degrading endonuclease RelE of RelBE toxin-antitoxin system
MPRQKPYELIYDVGVQKHVAKIPRKYHSLIRVKIKDQLRYEPEKETKNRKPLERPSVLGSAWELRLGPDNRFRVFYKVDQDAHAVHILAAGVKEKDELIVGGEVFKL